MNYETSRDKRLSLALCSFMNKVRAKIKENNEHIPEEYLGYANASLIVAARMLGECLDNYGIVPPRDIQPKKHNTDKDLGRVI